MKKITTLLSALFIAGASYAQTNVYHPFPADSAVWFGSTMVESGGTGYSYTQWLGDTVINTKHYTKIYTKPGSGTYMYIGGVRQDSANQKTYQINTSNVESDISVRNDLMVGDLFPLLVFTDSVKVSGVDSISIGGNFHKRYNLQSYNPAINPPTTGTFVIGVGYIVESSFAQAYSLYCFSIKNVNKFGSAPYCILSSGIDDVSNPHSISVSPNPFSTTATIRTNLSSFSLSIYTVLGQPVKQIQCTGNDLTLNRDDLPNGLYFAKIIEGNRVVASIKLMVVSN